MFIPRPAAVALLAAAATLPAAAGEVYAQFGFPYAVLGYAHDLGPRFALRADVGGSGRRQYDDDESGIDYRARLVASRAALLGDWFPGQGNFRLTAGATFNRYRIDLRAVTDSGSLTIGNTTYATSSGDGFEISVRYPRATPYIGLGWGHQAGSGWRFVADLGAMRGRPRLHATLFGSLAARVSQADVDAELSQVREDVDRVIWLPQLSFGVGYSF